MKAIVFPGQGAQFPGMGKDLYDASEIARKRFAEANEILGFNISDIMFSGTLQMEILLGVLTELHQLQLDITTTL